MTHIELAEVRVLLIDSAQNALNELPSLLENNGYEVIAVQTGGEGLQQMNRQLPDIILADLALPDMTGIALLKQIKATDPEMRVFLMGAHITPALICEAIRFGAVELLYKAFVTCSIIPKIEYLLNHDRWIDYQSNRKKSA
jgi:DNA-binding NtrC family response regulator